MNRPPPDRRPRVTKTDGRWGWECGCLNVGAVRWRDQLSAFLDANRHAGRHAAAGFRGVGR